MEPEHLDGLADTTAHVVWQTHCIAKILFAQFVMDRHVERLPEGLMRADLLSILPETAWLLGWTSQLLEATMQRS